MADRAHNTSRRALLAGLTVSTALGVAGARADTPHPDAALLAYEPRLRTLKAEMAARLAVVNDIEAAFHATLPPRPEWEDPAYAAWAERWRAAKDASGFEAAYEAYGTTVDALGDVRDEIAAIRASTLAGLCLKVRYGEGADVVEASIIADLLAIDAAQPAA